MPHEKSANPVLCNGGEFCAVGYDLGVQMSASHDHKLSPAHGHLNLIGFVALAVFGTYYALTPVACHSRMAAIHYGFTTVTVLLLRPGIVMAITGKGQTPAQLGSILGALSMALFVLVVLHKGVG